MKKIYFIGVLLLLTSCAMISYLPESMNQNALNFYKARKLYNKELPNESKFKINLKGRAIIKILISQNGTIINFKTLKVNEKFDAKLLEGTEFKNTSISKKQYYGAMLMKEFLDSENIKIKILRPVMDDYNSPMIQSYQIASFIAELESNGEFILKKYEIN